MWLQLGSKQPPQSTQGHMNETSATQAQLGSKQPPQSTQGHMNETSATQAHLTGIFDVKNMTESAGGRVGLRVTSTIRLRDIYDPRKQPSKAVPIRPPAPRLSSIKEQDLEDHLPSDAPINAIRRKRAQSLPSCSDTKRELRRGRVRFVDALGLDLEEVKVFQVQEHPLIPQHVMFRLMMSSELAFGKSAELSLPYFKPCFPDNMGAQPDFLKRLHAQRVCVEQVRCSEQGITGTVQVLNLAYEKVVKVHYSFTNWRTHTDTTASWAPEGCAASDTDLFRFRLHVPPFILQPGAILEFAVCYHVKGCDYWDNNNGNNYKLSCHSYKVTVPKECEDSMLHFT